MKICYTNILIRFTTNRFLQMNYKMAFTRQLIVN